MSKPVSVSVVRAGADRAEAIAQAVELAGLHDAFQPGQRVTIKPNWHGGQGYTSPEVVVAMARYARDRGAAEIVVADGPFYGSTRDSFAAYVDRMGVREGLERLGARVAYLHDEPYTLHRGLSPHLPPELGIASLALDCDLLVNLPLMKTHFGTLVTFGLKNLKGCIRPQDKAAFHQLELHAAVVALHRVLRPHVTVMDATTAYEGLGPSNGTPVPMGLVLCSANVVALDAVAVWLMGLEPRQVKLVQMAAKAGLGPMRLRDIDVRGEPLDAHRRTFVLPFDAFQANYPRLTLHHDHACSGCLGNLFSALATAGRDAGQHYPAICLGPGEPRPPGALLVGDCACRGVEGHPAVAGCPPPIADIIRALTRHTE